ncbi:hypothetical protein QTL91_24635, partial [Salmonella enterica subsp. enterica serovar Typhimurium]|nr:hypothetical protein [Salmonella enterica subsp. enterica serovar Typhimurium]
TVRLELALLSSLYNLASVEWGTCRTNPVEMVRNSGNTVRLELALLSSLYNLASVEWGTCRTNPVEMVR